MEPFLSKYPYFLSQCKCYYIIPINIIHYALKHEGISLLLYLILQENTYFPELLYTFAQCWCSCNKTCSCCCGGGAGGAGARTSRWRSGGALLEADAHQSLSSFALELNVFRSTNTIHLWGFLHSRSILHVCLGNCLI